MPEELKYDWENPRKIKHHENYFLNKIGNICGRIGNFISLPYYKWGTFWTIDKIDMTEDIDKDDY